MNDEEVFETGLRIRYEDKNVRGENLRNEEQTDVCQFMAEMIYET